MDLFPGTVYLNVEIVREGLREVVDRWVRQEVLQI